MMQGKGRLIATDHDKRQLAPIYERLSRAGVHNCDIRTPKGEGDTLIDIHASADLVLIDAPCTGTGTWRRNPDAKWRMRPGALEVRLKDQVTVLDRAAALVKPGGRIAYITLFGLAPGNRRADPRLRRAPSGFCHCVAIADHDSSVGQGGGFRCGDAAIPRGAIDDPAPHRDRWIFRIGTEKEYVVILWSTDLNGEHMMKRRHCMSRNPCPRSSRCPRHRARGRAPDHRNSRPRSVPSQGGQICGGVM